ncbi:hypothetical protein HOLleu_14501 [Holothuria leucospilota]|uniref:Sulfotransferase n=1 Tax=Holothuria leucospilota TaxID=206669 RepID=A0A9Q1C8S7_HOLLE|nr:hypothetical protein HOLleu_14501 [Holothuria leucospilota]
MVGSRSKLLTFVLHASVMGMLIWLFVLFLYKDSHAVRHRYFFQPFVTDANQIPEERSLSNDGGRKHRGKTVKEIGNLQESVVQYSSINKDKFPIIKNALRNYFLYVNDSKTASSYKATVLAFVHNQKSGGTTLKRCLSEILEYQNKEPVLVTNANRAAVEEKILNGVSESKPNDVFVGAATFGICENLAPTTCAYFTILRDPYERMISHYMFCRNGGETGLQCHNSTIEEYAISIGSLLFTHITAHMLCKKSCVSPNDDCENGTDGSAWRCERLYSSIYDVRRRSVLGYVIKNLDRFFAVIGLFEEYETSLALFQETFGLPLSDVCNGIHANEGTYPDVQGSNEDIGQQRRRYIDEMKRKLKANDTVRNNIEADVKIYERAREIFYKQKQIYIQTRS